VTDAIDPEATGLLDGLTDDARAQRAELIPWLLEQGITAEEIQASFAPDAAARPPERTGLQIDQLMRFLRASGLASVEDPDAAVYLRPDAEIIDHIKRFLDLGFDPDQMLTVFRTLAEGLSHAAAAIRYTGVASTVQHAGTTELRMAKGVQALVSTAAPLLSQAARDRIGDDGSFDWSFAGARRLKGIQDDVKLFRARRAEKR
jgi:adenylate cyclase